VSFCPILWGLYSPILNLTIVEVRNSYLFIIYFASIKVNIIEFWMSSNVTSCLHTHWMNLLRNFGGMVMTINCHSVIKQKSSEKPTIILLYLYNYVWLLYTVVWLIKPFFSDITLCNCKIVICLYGRRKILIGTVVYSEGFACTRTGLR
jgi:hypothetical protein